MIFDSQKHKVAVLEVMAQAKVPLPDAHDAAELWDALVAGKIAALDSGEAKEIEIDRSAE